MPPRDADYGTDAVHKIDGDDTMDADHGTFIDPTATVPQSRVTEGPTAQDREKIKPIFLRLYLKEEKKLEEVREILRNNYHFSTT